MAWVRERHPKTKAAKPTVSSYRGALHYFSCQPSSPNLSKTNDSKLLKSQLYSQTMFVGKQLNKRQLRSQDRITETPSNQRHTKHHRQIEADHHQIIVEEEEEEEGEEDYERSDQRSAAQYTRNSLPPNPPPPRSVIRASPQPRVRPHRHYSAAETIQRTPSRPRVPMSSPWLNAISPPRSSRWSNAITPHPALS